MSTKTISLITFQANGRFWPRLCKKREPCNTLAAAGFSERPLRGFFKARSRNRTLEKIRISRFTRPQPKAKVQNGSVYDAAVAPSKGLRQARLATPLTTRRPNAPARQLKAQPWRTAIAPFVWSSGSEATYARAFTQGFAIRSSAAIMRASGGCSSAG